MSKLKKLIKGVGAGAGVGFLTGLAMSGYGKSQASKKAPTSQIKKTPKSKVVKDPTTEGLRITRSKPFEAEDTADPTATGLGITRSRPFEAEDVAMPRTPVGFEYEQGIEGTFGPMAKKGKFIKTKKAVVGLFARGVGKGAEFIKRSKMLGTLSAARRTIDDAPSSIKRASEPASKLKRVGDIALGSGLTSAGYGYVGSEIEERDRKKGRQEKETKERTATEGSFMSGGSVIARGDKFSRNRSRPTKLS